MGAFRELTARALKGERVYTGRERDRHDAGESGQNKGTAGAKGLGASGPRVPGWGVREVWGGV